MKLYQWRPELRMWLVLRAEERAIREVQPVEDQRRDLEPGPLQILVDACGQSALNELEEVRDKAALQVRLSRVAERQDPPQHVDLHQRALQPLRLLVILAQEPVLCTAQPLAAGPRDLEALLRRRFRERLTLHQAVQTLLTVLDVALQVRRREMELCARPEQDPLHRARLVEVRGLREDVSSQRPVQALATLPAEQPPREPAELGPVLLLDDDVRAVGRRSLGKEVAQLPVQLLLIGATPPFLTRAQLLDVLQRQAVQPAIRARRDAQTASHRAQRRVVVE